MFDRLMPAAALVLVIAAGPPAAAGGPVSPDCAVTPSVVCAGHTQVAQGGDSDEPEEDWGASKAEDAAAQVKELQVCTSAGCRKADASDPPADLMRGIYGLLKANENVPIATCDSDPISRECKDSGFDLFVMAGPLPAYANLKTITFKNVRLTPDNTEITMRGRITGTFLGAPAICGEFDVVLTINARNNPVLKGKESFYCNWLVIGNIFWNYAHTFDYVNFANGVMGGRFEFSAIGLLTVGGAEGYGQLNLNPAAPPPAIAARETAPPPKAAGRETAPAAGQQMAAIPKASAPPAKLPSALALAPIQGADRQLAVLKDLHDKGLIDDTMFRRRKNAILQRMFGAVPPPAEAAQRPAPRARPVAIGDIQFGNYHALVIGNNAYRYLPNLRTAVNDARAIAALLQNDYGFRVTLLLDATRAEIIEAFDRMTETLGSTDNLVIYYAGHGWLDEDAGRGYWLATDAKPNRRANWVSNATLTDTLNTLQAKHVMVIADSCYSGTLTREAKIGVRAGDYWRRMAEKRTRVALVSGGLEPVSDGTGTHSPFAKAFIDALKSNEAIMDGTTLFSKIRRPVMIAANQTPQYTDVRQAGHEGGDFLFVRKR